MSFSAENILESTDVPGKTRREIPRVMNRLLGQTFFYQDAEGDKDDYYLVHRHRAIFAALLAASGFRLLHDDYHRIFQVVSDFGACRRRRSAFTTTVSRNGTMRRETLVSPDRTNLSSVGIGRSVSEAEAPGILPRIREKVEMFR